MLHLKNFDFVPKDAKNLLTEARRLCEGMSITLRDTRVSSKFVEYDVSVEKAQLDILIEKLKSIGLVDHAKSVVEEKIDKEKAIKDGIFYFNNERFWECHEVLEGVWKNSTGEERDIVQGIILTAAAIVHYQKFENEICLSILARAMEKLVHATGTYHGIDLDKLRENIGKIRNSGVISTFLI